MNIKEVYWRFFFRTNRLSKAEKLTEEVKTIMEPCKMINLKVYWKDKRIYCLELKQDIKNDNTKDVIFSLIKIMSGFSENWNLELPFDFDNDILDMSGICRDNIKLDSLTWISFTIQEKNAPILDIV